MKTNNLCFALMLTSAWTPRCGAEAKPPVPLWTHTVTWRDGKPPSDTRIVSATSEIVTVANTAGSVAALDARTGRELSQADHHDAALALPPVFRPRFPVHLQGQGVVTRVDTDNDMVGSSQWPKYLLCSDLSGRRVWQFPAKLEYPPPAQLGPGRRDMMMAQAIAVDEADVCLAVDEEGSVYGLRYRNGMMLWKQPRSHYQLEPQAVWKQGCFGFASAYWTAANWKDQIAGGLTTVSYLSAQTGKARPVLALPFILDVFVGGDTLYVQTAPATFRAYSIPSLMARLPRPPADAKQEEQEQSGEANTSAGGRAQSPRRQPYLFWGGGGAVDAAFNLPGPDSVADRAYVCGAHYRHTQNSNVGRTEAFVLRSENIAPSG